ncbi:hypothetical protein Rt10032_c18g6000 [Rhodotorula toruloides]|uniref:Uncharacterized protein n=1 Tax=Rhodotorula toruloides TaxID=5286 RepID=A0A511KNM8_RHOTO|nr:hypothetical protein Rt10032_c18g6000 [Rhodotorula toruloides]
MRSEPSCLSEADTAPSLRGDIRRKYMVHVGDPLNGSGTTTAWSLIYLLLNTRKAIVARSPAALAVTSVVATQAGLYGSYYFGQD